MGQDRRSSGFERTTPVLRLRSCSRWSFQPSTTQLPSACHACRLQSREDCESDGYMSLARAARASKEPVTVQSHRVGRRQTGAVLPSNHMHVAVCFADRPLDDLLGLPDRVGRELGWRDWVCLRWESAQRGHVHLDHLRSHSARARILSTGGRAPSSCCPTCRGCIGVPAMSAIGDGEGQQQQQQRRRRTLPSLRMRSEIESTLPVMPNMTVTRAVVG